MTDMVEHPPHYEVGKVEHIHCQRAMLGRDGFLSFCRGNALKYIFRCGKKANSVEDLRKAIWYLERGIEALEDKEVLP